MENPRITELSEDMEKVENLMKRATLARKEALYKLWYLLLARKHRITIGDYSDD